MSPKSTEFYRKLKPEDISLSVRANPNGNLDLIIGLYEKNGWKQHIKIELIGFPERCSNLDSFKNLAVRVV